MRVATSDVLLSVPQFFSAYAQEYSMCVVPSLATKRVVQWRGNSHHTVFAYGRQCLAYTHVPSAVHSVTSPR